ncbi:MAG: hypothetical protein ABI601_05190 [bacterium]
MAAIGSDAAAADAVVVAGSARAVTHARDGAATSPRDAAVEWRRAWEEDFGKQWHVDLGLIALIIFVFGAIRPLSDPDLPMHLSVGEWIVRHRAVPYVEPFAWTRAGAPYYDFAWLPQSVFYLVLDAFGHLGLRVLQGCIVLTSALSAMTLARTARLRPSQGLILAAMHVIVGEVFVAMLRPQSVLLIAMPLIWTGFLMIVRGERVSVAMVILFGASAVMANSHLFFPIALAPAALLLVYPQVRRKHAIGGVGSVLAGWVVAPYSPYWLEVFRHNLGSNILFRPPAAIAELQPGFVTMFQPGLNALIVLVPAMIAMPWVLTGVSLTRRERLMAALFWGLGLIVFGYATRLFLIWWLLTMLPFAWAIVRLTHTTETRPPRTSIRLTGFIACVVIIVGAVAGTRREWALEGDTRDRRLPTVGALAAEPLAKLLETRLRHGKRARALTTFGNGSFLTWRLPGLSASIDSRGVFPDSVAAAEAVVLASDRGVPLGPWRSADFAIVPVRFRVAEVLDTASEWRRIASAPGIPMSLDSVALWARKAWWEASLAPPAHP